MYLILIKGFFRSILLRTMSRSRKTWDSKKVQLVWWDQCVIKMFGNWLNFSLFRLHCQNQASNFLQFLSVLLNTKRSSESDNTQHVWQAGKGNFSDFSYWWRQNFSTICLSQMKSNFFIFDKNTTVTVPVWYLWCGVCSAFLSLHLSGWEEGTLQEMRLI